MIGFMVVTPGCDIGIFQVMYTETHVLVVLVVVLLLQFKGMKKVMWNRHKQSVGGCHETVSKRYQLMPFVLTEIFLDCCHDLWWL